MINGRQVFDCVPFYDELDILEIRLNVLDGVVDYFVLVESSRTFSGNKKPLYFSKNKQRFSKFLNKIRHIVIDDSEYEEDLNIWQREFDQKNAVFRGIHGCNKEDFVIVSDVDEIPDPKIIIDIVSQDLNSIGVIKKPCFYYFLNCKSTEVFDKARIAKLKNIKSPQQIRAYPGYSKHNSNKLVRTIFKWFGSIRKRTSLFFRFYKVYENAGWHFTYMKEPSQISKKIKDFSHTEFNSDRYTDLKFIEERIKNLKDPFHREYEFTRVEIDNSYPEYITNNLDKYSKLILSPDD